MKKTTFATTALLLFAVAGGLGAQDRPQHQHGHMHGGQHMMHHCPMMGGAMMGAPGMVLMHREELGLSASQVERIEAIHAEAQRRQAELHERMQPMHRQIAAATEGERFDEQAVRTVVREGSDLHADMMVSMLRAQHETRQVLTAEQRERLQQMHGRHHGHGAHGQHQGHGMGMMQQCPMMQGGAHQGGERHGHQHQH